jgi:hypothetical protein
VEEEEERKKKETSRFNIGLENQFCVNINAD